ncbi:PilW family protein, partial [Victivallis vadensis]|uniref:PilW family protein n=1 Tax=Victivallis vadensis TaxID=172901 RepID=UPI003AF6C1E1
MIRPIKSRRLNVRETQMFKEYKQIKRCFTLVELLVAMAVFSVMLLLMMQFFSGAQRIWVSTEQK